VIPAQTDEQSAYLAAELAQRGAVGCLMKGMINSSLFLKGVLHRDFHLRNGQLLSHLSIFEVPGFSRLLFLSDGGLNIHPNLAEKDSILLNAIDFMRRLGIDTPKVALLAANEQVNEKMPETLDAWQLSQRAQQGHFGSAVVEGPLPLDLAISKEAVAHKGITSKINGEADLLFAPTIEVGNVLGKAITYFGNGVMAGLVLGAKVPLILTSRADSYDAKLASIAFARLAFSQLLMTERS
jgi:phosphate butyryltransferase